MKINKLYLEKLVEEGKLEEFINELIDLGLRAELLGSREGVPYHYHTGEELIELAEPWTFFDHD